MSLKQSTKALIQKNKTRATGLSKGSRRVTAQALRFNRKDKGFMANTREWSRMKSAAKHRGD